MNRLSNKVALISGGARGIGEYTARLFLEEGASVIIGDKDLSRCKKTIKELQKEGHDCSFVALDVSKESDWIDAISYIESNYQKLDILINNAGIYNTIPIEETRLDDFNNIISVNLTGLFLGTKHSIPILRKAGGGSIVNISSTAGLVGNSGSGAYGASKGGVRSFTKYTAATATQSKTFTYTSNTAAIASDITLSQNSVGANGATAYVVDVNASASTIRVIDVTNGANASAGYDGKPGSFQCTTSNSASGFTGVSAATANFTYTGGNATLVNVANGSMQIGSGDIIYIENRAPVARASDQTEDIKLIIEF